MPARSKPAQPAGFVDVWRRDGAVLIPGFLPASETERLAAFGNDAYRICDGLLAQDHGATTNLKNGASANLVANFTLWHGVDVDDFALYLRRHDPARLAELRAIRRRVHTAVNQAFGVTPLSLSRWRRMRSRSFFRRHKDGSKYVPWHIDANAAVTAVSAADCFNVWLRLSAVGETAPSLEFVRGSHRRMRELPLFEVDVAERYRDDEWVSAQAAGERWAPVLRPGDAVLFDQYTLHRTQQAAGQPTRDSCEFRFMSVPQSWIRLARPILRDQAGGAPPAWSARPREAEGLRGKFRGLQLIRKHPVDFSSPIHIIAAFH